MMSAECSIVPGNCVTPIVSHCTRQLVDSSSSPSLSLRLSLSFPCSLFFTFFLLLILVSPSFILHSAFPFLSHTHKRTLWTDSNFYRSETFFAQSLNNANKESAPPARMGLCQLPQQPQPRPPHSQTLSTSITRRILPAERMSLFGTTCCGCFQQQSMFTTGRLSFLCERQII